MKFLFNQECSSEIKNIKFKHFDYELNATDLRNNGDFITINNLNMSSTSVQSIENFKLKKYLFEMKKIEIQIEKFSNKNPDSNILRQRSNVENKFEITVQSFFNITHSFPIDQVIRQHSSFEQAEVKKLINLSITKLDESKYFFLNGYKSFIPVQGLIYKMVFISKETKNAQSLILFRSLDSPQIISIDTFKQIDFWKKINLIFSIRDNSAQSSIPRLCAMVSKFSNFIKSANFLFIKYSSSNFTIPMLKTKKSVKYKIDEIKISQANLYYNDDYVQLLTIRHFSKKFPKKSLFVYMPSNVRFGRDALKRLIINTKIKKLVFFPIAYNFYAFSAKKSSLSNDNGYFESESKDIISFYNLDFIKFDNEKIESTFELFNKSNMEILNVADSDLQLEWTINKGCHFLNSNDSNKCIKRRLNSFGNHLNFLSFLFKN